MRLIQSWIEKCIGHKYAIDAKHLGDDAALAWSNLGYWQDQQHDYPRACQALADQMANAVQLKQTDRLLDLGCGQGASLLYWTRHYQLQHVHGIELQKSCIQAIQKELPAIKVNCASFLHLNAVKDLGCFDVIMCIDAAYHSDLNQFLDSACSVLKAQGRLAFHYLIWSETWQTCHYLKKQQYHYLLLKGADVTWQHLVNKRQLLQILVQHDLADIVIQDFSAPVLNGFAEYIEMQARERKSFDFAQLKIAMTAKLCHKLYQDGLLRYVQVSAIKK